MPVVRLEITHSESFDDGREFGSTGAYQRIDGIAHYAVDPNHPANTDITDLHLANRQPDGLVHFNGDFTVLVPVDGAKASGALLVEVPNRGNRGATRSFNQAPFVLTPTNDIDAGDGFLMRHGWCVAWVGWQWDMPQCEERLGLRAPMLDANARGAASDMHLRIQPDALTKSFTLTDHHVGAIGHHAPITPADAHDTAARLMVRDHLLDTPTTIARGAWSFTQSDGDGYDSVELEDGFEAGRIYDLLYTPLQCPVVGAGLLAYREFAAFARHDPASPFAGIATHTFGHGISQCGRFLRTLMHLGLNIDESGRQVFDGLQVHIAGARRGEFNHRFGQPSVQPTPSFGHLFPFADEPHSDPHSGVRAGLLDTLRERKVMPKVVYTDSSSEYWRGDAGLSHTDVGTDADAELPYDVRRYLFASTQHGPGLLPYADQSIFGSHGANHFNAIDYRPLIRSSLERLRQWVMDGKPPPASVYPRRADGTGVSRSEAIIAMTHITGLALPNPERLSNIHPLNLGAHSGSGIGQFPAEFIGDAYATVVSAVDAHGNEIGGVQMPDVTVPIGVHTGFNPRHADSGGTGQILEYVGSTVPNGPLARSYASRDAYLEQIRAAAERLVATDYLLAEDVALCDAIAGERYDAALAATAAEDTQ